MENTLPQQIALVLHELHDLLSKYGIGQVEKPNTVIQCNSAPPVDTKKHLVGLAEKVDPSVHVSQDSIQGQAPPPPSLLTLFSKPSLTTAEAAAILGRQPQTLRCWAMHDGIEGLRPIRINGRLAWSVAEIRKLLKMPA